MVLPMVYLFLKKGQIWNEECNCVWMNPPKQSQMHGRAAMKELKKNLENRNEKMKFMASYVFHHETESDFLQHKNNEYLYFLSLLIIISGVMPENIRHYYLLFISH